VPDPKTPPFPPIEPAPTEVRFPDPRAFPDVEVFATGSDFRPGTLLEAYRHGIFPWPQSARRVPWCSLDPRAVYPIHALATSPDGAAGPHWSRSLRRTLRKHPYALTVDRAFEQVVRACGDERPKERWIIPAYAAGFVALHALGWTHSVEVWEGEPLTGELVGGIYGIAIGGLFAGESMFHRRTDASKIAFATLVERLIAAGYGLFDVQVMNDHLESLGCVEIGRDEYLERLEVERARPAMRI
jgi:leucyl/phenylalanyl-tRNA--protein transferase